MNRRVFTGVLAGSFTAFGRTSAVRLSIGNYGMQGLEVDRALAEIRRIGYDGAELCLIPGWPSEPSKLDPAARRRIRESGIPIPSMIENFNLLVSDDAHRQTLTRIRTAAKLAHEIAPGSPPLLQSVMGGKPEEWMQVRDKMAARLAEWGRAAEQSRIKLAVKSHVSSASDTPEKLLWLLDRAASPALTAVYDYGHFELLNLDMEKTMEQLVPRSSFITVKDGKRVNGKPQFLLPGEGTIDYHRYCRKLRQFGYRGWMLVEVSRQLQTVPGYDPIAVAEKSYRHLAPILQKNGLR